MNLRKRPVNINPLCYATYLESCVESWDESCDGRGPGMSTDSCDGKDPGMSTDGEETFPNIPPGDETRDMKQQVKT